MKDGGPRGEGRTKLGFPANEVENLGCADWWRACHSGHQTFPLLIHQTFSSVRHSSPPTTSPTQHVPRNISQLQNSIQVLRNPWAYIFTRAYLAFPLTGKLKLPCYYNSYCVILACFYPCYLFGLIEYCCSSPREGFRQKSPEFWKLYEWGRLYIHSFGCLRKDDGKALQVFVDQRLVNNSRNLAALCLR